MWPLPWAPELRWCMGAHQERLSSAVVSGSAKEVPLREFALQLFEQADLLCRFSAFGYDLQTKVVSQHNDDAHDLTCFAVAVHLRNEGTINLQGVHRESSQSAQ